MNLSGITEQLADVEYYLIDNTGQNVQNQAKVFVNSKDQKHQISFKLGDKTADKD